MLSYAVVAEYYCPADSTPYLGFLSESLESDTNGLQAFIGNNLSEYFEVGGRRKRMMIFVSFSLLQRTTF